jgi:hypothetical protein
MIKWIDLDQVPSILQDVAQVCFASMFVEQFFVSNPKQSIIIWGLIVSLFLWSISLVAFKKFKSNLSKYD